MSVTVGDAAEWAKYIVPAVIGIGAIGGGLYQGFKSSAGKKAGASEEQSRTVVAVAGSFADGRKIDDLTDAIKGVKEVLSERGQEQNNNADQAHRDARALCDGMDSLTRALRENTDVQRRSPAADTSGMEALLRIMDKRHGGQ